MSLEIKIPDLGDGIASGTVANFLVSVGDAVEVEQPVLELETDKAVVEVPSEIAGTVESILAKAGDEVKVGQVIIKLSGDAAPVEKEEKPDPPKKEKAPEPEKPAEKKIEAKPAGGPASDVEIKVPDLGEGITSGTIANVLVAVGDEIENEQPIVELETDKAVVEVPADASGKVTSVNVKAGDEVKIGQALLVVSSTGAPAPAAAPAKAKAAPASESKAETKAAPAPAPAPVEAKSAESLTPEFSPSASGVPAPAAPSVRRFAREIGVNINEVKGSGQGGRISVEDVKAHSKALHQKYREGGVAAPSGTIAAPPLPDFSKWGEVDRQAMSKVRQKTAEHLSSAWATIPHVTQFDKADITELEALRKQFGKKAEAAGGKLTMTAILLKICASALKVFPQFNASVDMANKQVVYKKYINLGVAVDTDRGLLVPVIRDVDKKNIVDLSVELTEIAVKARDGKLSLDEMQGGNFTISNLGGIGGTAFTPIVNAPEVAILGVSRGSYEPVYKDGEFVPRLMLPLSLSYDHRLIDGADGARFIRWLAEAIEQPFKIVLEG